ncbi:uncharacterized protein IUM83_06361 [Phytophthora cinnamomi]|uniref:uncharacterized protein n=1 Tax=Phytophthora cinnamomi TaxID=4785 RepID=UPI0035599C1E|nr:hypothetical protein IUM83_06361 [Phytophthora cinnamomi]
MDTKQQVDTRALSNNASSTDEAQTFRPEQADSTPAKRREYVKTRAATKKSSEFGKQSPTKRKPSVLKRLRGDLRNGRPSPAGVENGSPSDKSSMTRSSSTSLLDVYSLRLSRTEDFVTVCGEPGFADLDLDEVSEFARLAHYRARVLAGKHARVDNLDTKTVKPQWLQDLERAVVLVETQQQRNLVSGKVVIESDSITLLSEVHTRLVLQVTTVWRQYTRDFGESSFTRRLRTLTRRLVDWKFTRISEVVAALCEAKSTAMQEEKHRNLEFYHVHHSRQLNE